MPRSCVIFDFDGVIADTERLHLQAYNEAFAHHAAAIGGVLQITSEAYFAKYIVYSNREGFRHMLQDADRPHDPELVARLCRTKDELFEHQLGSFAEPLPGVRPLLAWLEERGIPRGICSGAARNEINILLDSFALRPHFDVIITIEDVRYGKPDPEGYNLAFDRLRTLANGKGGGSEGGDEGGGLEKKCSLVVEDSPGGCAAARAAGIPVLGVATSLPLDEVRRCADHAVQDLSHLNLEELRNWLGL